MQPPNLQTGKLKDVTFLLGYHLILGCPSLLHTGCLLCNKEFYKITPHIISTVQFLTSHAATYIHTDSLT